MDAMRRMPPKIRGWLELDSGNGSRSSLDVVSKNPIWSIWEAFAYKSIAGRSGRGRTRQGKKRPPVEPVWSPRGSCSGPLLVEE